MRKLIVLCVCLLAASASLFASGGKEREPGSKISALSGAYQGDFYSVKDSSGTRPLNLHGIALGIDSREMYTQKVGLFVHVGVDFPLAGIEDTGRTTVGVDFLFAPAFIPVQTEKLSLNINPGVHFNMLLANSLVISFGLGTDISTYFYLSESFFLVGGVVASYDFFSIRSEGNITSFHVKPRLGLGVRW